MMNSIGTRVMKRAVPSLMIVLIFYGLPSMAMAVDADVDMTWLETSFSVFLDLVHVAMAAGTLWCIAAAGYSKLWTGDGEKARGHAVTALWFAGGLLVADWLLQQFGNPWYDNLGNIVD